MTSLKDIGEFGLIDRIKRVSKADSKDIILGIGDDCAIIKKDSKTVNLVSTDLLVESVHFDMGYFSPTQLGMKAAASNISDIAAMGGIPKYILVSIAINKNVSYQFVKDIFAGIKKVTSKYGVELIGGDTSASKGKLLLSVTVIGEAKTGVYVRRDGSRAGDRIFVTGTLGNSAAGLDILKRKRGVGDSAERYLANRHLDVRPRVSEGAFFAKSGAVTAMIDLSDGLGSDIRRICEASKVGALIRSTALPVSRELKRYCKGRKRNPQDFALYGGEDYELLFTVKAKETERLKAAYKKKFKKNIHEIGEVTKGSRIQAVDDSGNISDISNSYEHFLSHKDKFPD